MDRPFKEIFPSLKLDDDWQHILEGAVVTRLGTTKDHSCIRIYLQLKTLVPKRKIIQLEEQIKKQIFASKPEIRVHVIESFLLSVLYTPQTFYDAYRDSMLEELEEVDNLALISFKDARIDFSEEGKGVVTLKDTLVAKEGESLIHDFLHKVFCERGGFSIIFEFNYVQTEFDHKSQAKKEHYIANRIYEIQSRVDHATNQAELLSGDSTKIESTSDFDYKAANAQAANAPGGAKSNDSARRSRPLKRSNRDDVCYGKEFEDEAISIAEIQGEIGEVAVRGKIINVDLRPIRGERTILSFAITDFTDTITDNIYIGDDQLEEISRSIYKGAFLKIKATPLLDKFDHDLTLQSINGIMIIPDFTTKRKDNALAKRVELHCHTKMSDMDGVSDAGSLIKRAHSWGHPAIAITDHGVVQAFPEADHALHDLKDPNFKVIYGCEIYLVDDTKTIVKKPAGQSLNGSFVVFDIETTGLNPDKAHIIEIGAVKIVDGQVTDRFSKFINPHVPISYTTTKLTSIVDDDVINEPDISVILPEFLEFCRGSIMVAHNADFDMGFIMAKAKLLGLECDFTYVDTLGMARFLLPKLNRFTLDAVAKELNVKLEQHHRAVYDAECTAYIFIKFISMLKEQGINDLSELNEQAKITADVIKKMKSYHCIVLAKNDIGRINLYRLVSAAHLTYFNRRPRVPKSLLMEHREGLIIGSACEAGELYRAMLDGRSEEELLQIARFYDYLEIQPTGNNAFMLRPKKEGEEPIANSIEELQEHNRRIVALADELGKPTCATCDVHFLDPEDEVYRRIIMAGKGFDDADDQAPLYLRTTEEMLEEFKYLGEEKAEEVVVTNTNLIANMCEPIAPVRPDKCPPVMENSDEELRKICYEKAHEIYGEDLPEVVEKRLERELNSIISNGYAVMYIIAQKLVWKSNEDGYLVGSRGSVGSSFAATMAGITEVNPLSPHYICSNCYFTDFDSPEVLAFSGHAGCDMPDRNCPNCGKKLIKEGFDIPFETFLGFKGNKEPDIDLNFSGDYQGKAHRYTEVIFGTGQTFKAGTVGTLADKTAYGYIKNYYEERGITKRGCEIDRIVSGCVGVRRTTGQHPGGIIVLPKGEEIHTFTPVQHPADKTDTDIITTHFDYHSIDSNLLKLDILGHDDPTMIRMLEDLTGLNAKDIPLDDKGVMSLFKNTEALGVTPEDLMGCEMGTLGIPEFGTDFAMGMLRDAKPQQFTDLICISGLSHGTDVWLGNAQTLIEEGKATISTCISTRDDIMTYLIHMGLDSEESFKIMESTRKGIIAKGKEAKWPEYQEHMREHGVPEWYIGSCEKIKYMFPKAHAAAYVMMAWRIAFCKVYYPLAYYTAFFTIRATDFNYELMCLGREKLEGHIREYQRRDKLSTKEEGTLRDMRIVQEMYARGFEFLPMDIYTSDAKKFQIIDGELLPPFTSFDGLGDKAAESLAQAAQDGPFLSKEDIRNRGRVNGTIVDTMERLGIIKGLPESNQLSFFDLAKGVNL